MSQRRNNNKKSGWRGHFKRGRGGRDHNNTNQNDGRILFPKPQYRHQEQLTEEEVGISEYVSTLDGYSAVIKARYSDFQVNEIDWEGKIAKLTDTSVPASFASQPTKIYSYENTKESPSDKIPQDIWDALKNLVEAEVEASDNIPVELEADSFSKDDRKTIHSCVKRYFGQKIVASTITKDGKSILQFKRPDRGPDGTTLETTRNQLRWPENVPEYVHFLVYKESMDTMVACFKIAQALRISAVKIGYAGVKDKRAKTTQWFSIKKCEPSKLLSRTKGIFNLRVGNITFKDTPLKIGQLKGNKFRIALRNVLADDDLITSSFTHVKEHGFINYYGLQRFGNDKEVPTFSVGIKLLQGEWKEAIELILKVKAAEDPTLGLTKAKKIYAETGNAADAMKFFGKFDNCLEKKLLEGLAKHHGNDYVNALDNIPRNIRLMYIHAYQSLLWNKIASKRIHEFGFKPVEGDLVFVDNSQEEEPLIGAEDDETESTVSDTADDRRKPDRPSVRPLTVDELEKFTIFDIILPLPGYDIVYPANLVHHYKEALEDIGLSLEMPKQKVRTYNLSGAYRSVVQRVKDLEWKIMYYNDPTDNLIRSDLEELKGEEEPKSLENGQYKAVVVNCILNSASYATMVLREILKCNTSSSSQAGLNNYEHEKADKSNEKVDVESQIDGVQEGSLLADQAKYEDFKNKLFTDILSDADSESSKKRELETESNEEISKKLKTDD